MFTFDYTYTTSFTWKYRFSIELIFAYTGRAK